MDDSGDFVCLFSNEDNDHKTTEKATHIFWVSYSGATSHMAFNKDIFWEFWEVAPVDVSMGDKSRVKVYGRGQVKLNISVGGRTFPCLLKSVLYVPSLRSHLLWVGVLDLTRHDIIYEKIKCQIRKNERLIGKWHLQMVFTTWIPQQLIKIPNKRPAFHSWLTCNYGITVLGTCILEGFEPWDEKSCSWNW